MAQTLAVVMPYIAAGATVASTAVGAISSIQAGKAEERASERQAAQLTASAEQARKSAAQEAEDVKKEHQRIMAAQRARYGASGLTMEGTPLLVQMESLKESEEELRRILEEGEIKARGYEAGGYEAEKAGEEAARSGYVGAGKSLLSGTTSLLKIGKEYATPGKSFFSWW